LAKLTPSDGAAEDLFGLGLAADGDLLAVGAPFADIAGDGSRVVYLFTLSTLEQVGTLLASDTTAGDRFGRSIAIDGNLIVVGANRADAQGDVSGAAYIFDRVTRQQLATLLPSDGEAGDVFGNAVAVSGNRVLVGAEGDDDAGDFAGAAYLFAVDIDPCPADTNGDGLVTPADLNAWVLAFNAQAPECDQNGDGLCTPADFNAWVLNFNAGCP
ncbi:MAG: FG-GAP repeat protein, partial [Planctomycetota bacterium]